MALAEVAIRALATFVVATVFYTLTVHLAATFVLEEASIFEAILVGPITAAVTLATAIPLSVGTQTITPLAALIVIPIDFFVISWSYELDRRMAGLVTLGHFVVSILLAASLIGLFG